MKDKTYVINCSYRNGIIHCVSLEVDGQITDTLKWPGQIITSLTHVMNLQDYIQDDENFIPGVFTVKQSKLLVYPLLNLCELLGINIQEIHSDKKLMGAWLADIHDFAVWLRDINTAKNLDISYVKIDSTDMTIEYIKSKEQAEHTLIRYTAHNIFTLGKLEFLEFVKSGIPYITCLKCNAIYFTHKVLSTKTCPFCESPSLEKDRRAIDRAAQRLLERVADNKNSVDMFKKRFMEYLTKKRRFSNEEAQEECQKQLERFQNRR